MSRPHADEYGWTAVPRSRINVVPSAQTANPPLRVFHYELPDTAAVQAALNRAKSVLSTQTYNHAMRVYCFALTIVSNQFPSWIAGELKVPFLETLVLACLFHDLGSRDEIQEASYMSFQWLTGTEAMKELHGLKTLPRLQIESVCEAIFKLAILKDKGYTPRVGQLLELVTEIDNFGFHTHLVHPESSGNVCRTFPREFCSNCFQRFSETEDERKPWCLNTHDLGFVRDNTAGREPRAAGQ